MFMTLVWGCNYCYIGPSFRMEHLVQLKTMLCEKGCEENRVRDSLRDLDFITVCQPFVTTTQPFVPRFCPKISITPISTVKTALSVRLR
jgi:hypothetical protein